MRRLIYGALATVLIFSLSLMASAEENVYRRASNGNMQIALTFDDGPHPGRTPEILDILKKYNIKATFFVIGQNVEYYPKVFERTVNEGHEIGNHTFSHRNLKAVDKDTLEDEFYSFESSIADRYSDHVISVRPPEGSYDDVLKAYAAENNYRIVLWSVDTMDWAHRDVDKIVETVLSETDSGDIILMHDYISGSSPTPTALEIIIPKLLERGFEFVTVSELLKEK